jgi:dihydrofolate reductase
VARLKTDANLVTFGSRITWNALLAAGQVDELHLVVGATALGEGKPAFPAAVAALTPVGCRRLDESSNVLLRYAA